MNKKVTDCDIVLELLPLYIEQKTGTESNTFVTEHLEECETCREVHALMSAEANVFQTDNVQSVSENNSAGLSDGDKKVLWVGLGLLAYFVLMVVVVIGAFMYLTGM